MNYSEMSDEQINHAVAVTRGYKITEINGWVMHQVSGDDLCTDFCNSWADAGPIIADNHIAVVPYKHVLSQAWSSEFGMVSRFTAEDRNPLRAAMIVFLMMKEAE